MGGGAGEGGGSKSHKTVLPWVNRHCFCGSSVSLSVQKLAPSGGPVREGVLGSPAQGPPGLGTSVCADLRLAGTHGSLHLPSVSHSPFPTQTVWKCITESADTHLGYDMLVCLTRNSLWLQGERAALPRRREREAPP